MVSSLCSYRMSTRKSRIRATTPSQYTALSMNYFWCCCAYHFRGGENTTDAMMTYLFMQDVENTVAKGLINGNLCCMALNC